MKLLEMQNIDKSFFGNQVLKSVSLVVEKGEVHALLGENGAGKSTLMNILAGVYTKDAGTVVFDEEELAGGSVIESEEKGIAFVHQELNILNDLKVYENLFLNKEITNKFGKLKKKDMILETKQLFDRLGIDIDPETSAGDLDTSKKQLLEIGKALHSNAKLIILDEPTTALSNNEIDRFFDMIDRLKKDGTSFIFISHKMPEIFRIADSYTVFRNGEKISTGKIADVTAEKVTSDMVGSSVKFTDTYHTRDLGEVVLELDGLTGEGYHDINLSLRKGEIIGFTGLQGSGCSEVLQSIFGVMNPTAGTLKFHGKEVKRNSIHEAMKDKVAMVAANRKENSLIPSLSILQNTYISEHTLSMNKPVINKKKETANYEDYKAKLNIKATSPSNLLASLSGGNQQKVIIARWLNTGADILLLDNPTQGIDVGAKDEIYKLIMELSQEGKSIIVNTLEIPEIQKIADRCFVFYHGGIAAELERMDIQEDIVMLHATNALFDQEKEN